MKNETKMADDQAVENLCAVLTDAPLPFRADLLSQFIAEVGAIPPDWETIVGKIVRGEGSSSVGFKIRELWAYVSEEEDGTEGICGWMTPHGMRPMIGADKERVVSLRPKARLCAQVTGIKVKLVKFSAREDLEEITP